MKGKFIVFDGPDLIGKGTQATRLVKYIFERNKRNHIFFTREPYISQHYDEIRRILKEGKDPKDNAELLTDLWVKDRRVHEEVIRHLISLGIHVVSDRYKYSTLVYQQTQGISLKRLIEMHKDLMVPDLTLILDVPAEVALQRMAKDQNRKYSEVFEKLDFQKQLRENFFRLIQQLPKERIVIIDGNKSEEEVFESVRIEVDKVLAA